MAYDISYGGDDTTALRDFLESLMGREFYAEITAYGDYAYAGAIYTVDRDTNEVVLDEVDEDYIVIPDGKTFTVDLNDIAKLHIP